MKRKKLIVDVALAHREPTTPGAARVAKERTGEIIKAWRQEQVFSLDEPRRDPIRELAESCYLQGVIDSGLTMQTMNEKEGSGT